MKLTEWLALFMILLTALFSEGKRPRNQLQQSWLCSGIVAILLTQLLGERARGASKNTCW